MTTGHDVSIIVIAHDVREEVLACLSSIRDWAGSVSVETILVDNASRDGTAEAVAAAFPDTVVVRLDKNHGLAARNFGLRRATGRLRMFLDSDALLTEGALSELTAFLDRSADVGLVGPRLVYPDGTLQLSTRRFPPLLLPVMRRPPLSRFLEDSSAVRHHLMADDPHDRTREVEYVLGACQLFTAEAQAHARGIDPRMFFGPDDADWCFQIRDAGLKIMYHPAATVVHGYRRASLKRPLSRIALEQLKAHVRFQWKWRRERRRLIREGLEMDRRAGNTGFGRTGAIGGAE
jgi:GT2 family glycosyltransferase